MGVPVPVICCLIAGVVIVLIFCGAFFVELFFPNKKENNTVVKESKVEEVNDFDIDEMLSKLEEKTAKEETKVVSPVQPVISKAVIQEKAVEEENKKEEVDFEALFKQLEEEAKLNQLEEQKAKETEVDELPKMAEFPATKAQEKSDKLEVVEKTEKKVEIKVEEVKPIAVGPEFDYNVRIQTINDSLVRLEKDLAKASRDVNKYEKTKARKEKNEKLLDRKSAELTNLNLVLYNVNNIEDIDPEKKKKQEALMEHIAELKTSIKTADEYLSANQEKYQNNKKIKDFLTGEKARYNEEITELEQLIAEGKKKKH